MDREFKFRVWFREQKKFKYGDFQMFSSFSFPLNWCEVQQFTGLKDKTGRDIYEGDIVEGFNSRMRYEVVFDEYQESHAQYVGFKLKCYDKENNNKPFLSSFGDQIKQKLLKQDCKLVVIGNIFENSELLAWTISSNTNA